MATVPQLHHADLLLFHSLLYNYSWFTSTGESSRVMLIPPIIISQTGSRPEQSWRTTEVLRDMIMKQTGLWATSASCYRQVLSAWLQGQIYMDLAGPLTPLHLHLPQYQQDSWDSPSRYKLYVSWAGSTLRLTCQFTICQKNHGLSFHPRGSLFSYTWVHVEGHEVDWDKLVTPPKSCLGSSRTGVGLRHHQDVRMTDPLNPKGGLCCLCRNIR